MFEHLRPFPSAPVISELFLVQQFEDDAASTTTNTSQTSEQQEEEKEEKKEKMIQHVNRFVGSVVDVAAGPTVCAHLKWF